MIFGNEISGLIAAVFTPFRDDGELNLDVVPAYYQRLKSDGINGVFVCGTAGEGLSLTINERKLVLEAWCKSLDDDNFKVIAHVGSTSYKESIELAEHAQSCKVSAVSTIAPCFFKPLSVIDLVEYCALIANSCRNTPFYFYHIPGLTGVDFSMYDFLQAAESRIPSLAGLKFNFFNMYEYQKCLLAGGRKYNVLFGQDENILGALTLGGTGAVGSLYNQMGKVFNHVIDAYRQGDIAKAASIQLFSVKLVEIMGRYRGSVVCGKAIQKMIGLDCGPVRSPLRSLSDTEFISFERELNNIDFFNQIK